MAEYIRSVKVVVEVDTNKTTYRFHFDGTSPDEAMEEVREFIETLP